MSRFVRPLLIGGLGLLGIAAPALASPDPPGASVAPDAEDAPGSLGTPRTAASLLPVGDPDGAAALDLEGVPADGVAGGDELPRASFPDEPSGEELASIDDAPWRFFALDEVIDRYDAEPFREAYFPFLDDDSPEAAVSIGDTSFGRLVNAERLHENPALGILPRQKARGLSWGSADLVRVIRDAAADLYAQTGTRMWIGNVGRRGGGDIPYSVSHNSGRDADIAFCYRDARGAVDPPDLVRLDADGLVDLERIPKTLRTREVAAMRFDVKRTWIVVRSMLQHPTVQVQFLFLSEPLKKKLLTHARMLREPPALIERAVEVLRQPGNSHPHDDHLHLRVYCSARDVAGGCINTGLNHKWVDLHLDARRQRIETARAKLFAAQVDERRHAVERLALLDDTASSPWIAGALVDDAPQVRAAAATGLAQLGDPTMATPLEAAFGSEHDLGVRVALLSALADVGSAAAGELYAKVLADPTLDPEPAIASSEPFLAEALLPALAPSRSALSPASADHQPVGSAAAIAEALFAFDDAVAEPARGGSALDAALLVAGGTPAVVPIAPRPPTSLSTVLQQRVNDERSLLRLATVTAAGRSDRLEPIPPLLGMLDHRDPLLRGAAARALARITNRAFGERWDDPTAPEIELRAAADAWRAWIDKLGKVKVRDAWVAAGFLASGYRVRRLDREAAWELVRATMGPEHIAANAHKALMRITQHRPPAQDWSASQTCHYWLRWLAGRRTQLRLDPPPPATARACR